MSDKNDPLSVDDLKRAAKLLRRPPPDISKLSDKEKLDYLHLTNPDAFWLNLNTARLINKEPK